MLSKGDATSKPVSPPPVAGGGLSAVLASLSRQDQGDGPHRPVKPGRTRFWLMAMALAGMLIAVGVIAHQAQVEARLGRLAQQKGVPSSGAVMQKAPQPK